MNRFHVPAQMMQSWSVGFRQRDEMMIAAVNAVHESNPVAGPVRQPQAEHRGIEMYGASDIGCENQDVSQASRSDRRDRRPVRCILRSDPPLFIDANRLLVWRGLFTDTNFDEQSVRIPEPYSVGLEARRGINLANFARLQPFAKSRKVVSKCAEGQIGQFLLRTFAESTPAVRGDLRHDGQTVVHGSNIE